MAKAVTGRTGGFTYDASEFRGLAKKLREVDRRAYKDYRRKMIEVGEIIAEAARTEIEPYSKSIPPTIHPRVLGTKLMVEGGSEDVPIGRLFEYGNAGGSKSAAATRGGRFRHPVFGDEDNWVSQEMHPYLFRAMLLTRRKWRREVGKVLKEAFERVEIPVT